MTALTYYQLPGLLFEHPSSNVWNNAMNFLGRALWMRNTVVNPIRVEETSQQSSFSKGAQTILGTISLAGLACSFLKNASLVPDNQISNGIMRAATILGLIEGGIVASNVLSQKYPKATSAGQYAIGFFSIIGSGLS